MKLHDEVTRVPVKLINPNPWNPNKQSDFIFDKEKESIKKFGFIDPVLIRKKDEQYQIIDGEHRWLAAKDLQMEFIPAIVLDVDDVKAKQLTIIMNETRGEADPALLSKLLNEINQDLDFGEMLSVLPFTDKEIQNIMSIATMDWDAIVPGVPGEDGQESASGIVEKKDGSKFKTISFELPDDLYDRIHACFFELGVDIEEDKPSLEIMNQFVLALEGWVQTQDPEE